MVSNRPWERMQLDRDTNLTRFIAQEQPPHLAAMAPWEGLGDYYRQSICRGGIPDHAFWDLLFTWSGGIRLFRHTISLWFSDHCPRLTHQDRSE